MPNLNRSLNIPHKQKHIISIWGNKFPRDPFIYCALWRIQLETFSPVYCRIFILVSQQYFSFVDFCAISQLNRQRTFYEFQKVNDCCHSRHSIPSTCRLGAKTSWSPLNLWSWHISAFLVVNSSTFSCYAWLLDPSFSQLQPLRWPFCSQKQKQKDCFS